MEKLIKIVVENGCVTDVTGIPDGYLYQIVDLDAGEIVNTDNQRIRRIPKEQVRRMKNAKR